MTSIGITTVIYIIVKTIYIVCFIHYMVCCSMCICVDNVRKLSCT